MKRGHLILLSCLVALGVGAVLYLKSRPLSGVSQQTRPHMDDADEGPGGDPPTITTDEPERVSEHPDEPTSYRRAIAKMERGHFSAAIADFVRAMEDEHVGEWIHPYSMFHIARCQQRAGKYGDAVAAYRALLREYPNNVFLPEVHQNIGNCCLEMGDIGLPDAASAFRELEQLPGYLALSGAVGQARVLEAQKKLEEAIRKYQDIVERIEASDSKWRDASLIGECYGGLGRCFLARGQLTEARRILEELRDRCLDRRDRQGLAIAYNGLGDCERSEGNLEAAVLDYLRVNTLYGCDDEEQDARALYSAAQCYQQLAGTAQLPQKELHRKTEWLTRSDELYQEVVKMHPGSSYARKADRVLRAE